MKILSIKFKNINSLEGEHYINFEEEPFKNTHIFAITGPTGSGKSTILDVICLSLYNKTPRMLVVTPDNMITAGAIITRGKNDAYAQVKYQCEKGIFISEWSIRTKRTGNIDDIKMFVYDREGKPINQKKSEATEINIANIRLNYEQFVKSVILAQGDFSLFLKSNKKERGAILEQITGIEIYRELGKLAFRKNKEFSENIKLLENRKADIQSKILTEESYNHHKKLFNDNISKINAYREDEKQLFQKIELKRQLKKQKEILSNIESEIQNNEEKYKNFINNSGNKLFWHKKTNEFSDDLYKWKEKKEKISILDSKLNKINEENIKLETDYNQFVINVSNFIKETCNKDDINSKLLSFRDNILSLQDQKQQKANEYKAILAEINSELKNFYPKIEFNRQDNHFYSIIEEYIHTYKNKIEILKEKLGNISNENINEIIEKEQKELKKVQEIELKSLEINSIIVDKDKKVQEIKLKYKEIDNLPDKIKINKQKIEKEHIILNNYRLEKENNDLKKSLEDHRKKLIQGEPCPLCGSVHHIYSNEEKFDNKEDENKIKEQEFIVQKLQIEITSDENKLEIITKQIEKLSKEVNILENLIQTKLNEFEKEYNGYKLNENWREMRQQKDIMISNLTEYQNLNKYIESGEIILPLLKSISKIIEEVSSRLQQYTEIETKINEIKKQIKSSENELEINNT